ncbi:hypothetical protein LTR53_005731 [Teratosphaeriaceae sp. CCFEE 6253]|nr:hypothetical protein LTR53_005731 [Teratosphaeriaceae sp. CCFEE 6253]
MDPARVESKRSLPAMLGDGIEHTFSADGRDALQQGESSEDLDSHEQDPATASSMRGVAGESTKLHAQNLTSPGLYRESDAGDWYAFVGEQFGSIAAADQKELPDALEYSSWLSSSTPSSIGVPDAARNPPMGSGLTQPHRLTRYAMDKPRPFLNPTPGPEQLRMHASPHTQSDSIPRIGKGVEDPERPLLSRERGKTAALTRLVADYPYEKRDQAYFCEVPQCRQLRNSFQTESNLRKHQRYHIPYELHPHVCEINGCEQRFLFPAHLKDHQGSEHRRLMFYCQICGQASKRYQNLVGRGRHMDRAHPGAPKPNKLEASRDPEASAALGPVVQKMTSTTGRSAARDPASLQMHQPDVTFPADHTHGSSSSSEVYSSWDQEVPSGDNNRMTSVTAAPTTTQASSRKPENAPIVDSTEHHDDNADTRSIHTDGRHIGVGISKNARERLAERFAVGLIDRLAAPTLADRHLTSLARFLLLFSRMLSDRARPGAEQTACTFVRHHRKNIERYAREHLQSEQAPLDQGVEKVDVSSWASNVSGGEFEAAKLPSDMVDLPEEDAERSGEIELGEDVDHAQKFLFDSEEFRWLLTRVERAACESETGPEYDAIRDCLFDAHLSLSKNTIAVIDWDPYHMGIVPISPSAPPLLTVDQTTRSKPWVVHKVSLAADPHLSTIKMRIEDCKLQACVSGLPIAVIEAIEVLVWIGAACRASSDSHNPMYCSTVLDWTSPSLASVTYIASPLPSSNGLRVNPVARRSDHTSGSSTLSPPTLPTPESTECWTQLVRNPLIAKGYPIARRDHSEKGLEIDIGLMATLAKATRATVYEGTLVLRGFCTALVAVAEFSGSIIWHYLAGRHNKPLSYAEARKYCSSGATIGLAAFRGSRHFMGWTNSASILTGTANASYDVDFTGDDFVSTGCALKGVTVGLSKMLTLSTTLMPGIKDTRLTYTKPECYRWQIEHAESMRVVFYDTRDKRAWLVHGADALLHLSRAYLSSPCAPPARHGFSAQLVQDFVHRDVSGRKQQSARKLLCKSQNRRICICPPEESDDESRDRSSAGSERGSRGEPKADMRFGDLVSHFYEILWEMQSHQVKIRESEQWTLPISKKPFTALLEGFGFADTMTLQSPMRPRFAHLSCTGPSWLRVTDTAEAINILGSGFGSLITARSDCRHCTDIPGGHNFLGTTAEMLHFIARYRGGVGRYHLELAKGIYWNRPARTCLPTVCHCSSATPSHGIKCGVSVTELDTYGVLPLEGRELQHPSIADVEAGAAVIIGSKQSLERARSAARSSIAFRVCPGCRSRQGPSGGHSRSPERSVDHVGSDTSQGATWDSSTLRDSGSVSIATKASERSSLQPVRDDASNAGRGLIKSSESAFKGTKADGLGKSCTDEEKASTREPHRSDPSIVEPRQLLHKAKPVVSRPPGRLRRSAGRAALRSGFTEQDDFATDGRIYAAQPRKSSGRG